MQTVPPSDPSLMRIIAVVAAWLALAACNVAAYGAGLWRPGDTTGRVATASTAVETST